MTGTVRNDDLDRFVKELDIHQVEDLAIFLTNNHAARDQAFTALENAILNRLRDYLGAQQ